MAQSVSEADGSSTRVGASDFQIPRLVIERCTNIPNIGQRLELSGFPFIIGRSTPVFSLESDVSRQHAEINFDPANRQYMIVDLHSTNGITLNGVKIDADTPYEIIPGTKIGMGKFVLVRFEV
jgi:pSer/pThr/pTyr-binding forkhead associated (FHA) protein